MRYYELNNIFHPASNEESELIEKIKKENFVFNNSLNDREKELARILTSKGLLVRIFNNHKMGFKFAG